MNRVQRVLPPVVSASLLALIGYQLNGLRTLFDRNVAAGRAIAPDVGPPSRTPTPNLDALVAAHLFGEAPVSAAPPEVANIVPNTSPGLVLKGVLSEGGENGMAIVASSKQEKLYRVGDTIEETDGVRLRAVYADHLLLQHGQSLEALHFVLAGGHTTTPRAVGASPALPDPVVSEPPRTESDEQTVATVVRIAPFEPQGQFAYRVDPVLERREAFAALGLQPGDVVSDVNGTPVADTPASRRMFIETLLGGGSLTVLRKKTSLAVLVNPTRVFVSPPPEG